MTKDRPYFRHSGTQLEELYHSGCDDLAILRLLLEELKHRDTPKAARLRKVVEDHLNVLPQRPVVIAEDKTPIHRPEENFKLIIQGPQHLPANEYLSGTDDGQTQAPLKEEEPDTAASFPRHVGVSSIRAPGRIQGVPTKRVFEQKSNTKVEYARGGGLVAQYVAGLRVLIEEMRRKGAGVKHVAVTEGHAIPLDGSITAYQFTYEGDGDLFEGAKITAIVNGQKAEGQISAVMEKKIVINIDHYFGPYIELCTLRIDNTAMLDALRDRLEVIGRGEVNRFNTRLATCVLNNEGVEKEWEAIPFVRSSIPLSSGQHQAIQKALTQSVFYLWGPPGTGKTQTLSALIEILFHARKRVLICSNTNQAVDQVLLKLCTLLGKDDPAVDEGRILRIGRIASQELLDKWSDYVTVEGVVERRSSDLQGRREFLERQLEALRGACIGPKTTIRRFADLDQIRTEVENLERKKKLLGTQLAQERVKNFQGKASALETKSRGYESASLLARLLMPSLPSIQADLARTNEALAHARNDAAVEISALHEMEEELDRKRTTEYSLQKTLGYADRSAALQALTSLEKKMEPLEAEGAEITRLLNALATSILGQAKILGATATKLFLSPQNFDGFDVVIIDEASMLLLPALFHAAGMAKERVVISGDFRQLPPILQTDEKEVIKAIGGDIFTKSGIANILETDTPSSPRASLLNEQHRMTDPICQILSKPMYLGKLITAANRESTGISLGAPFDGPLTIIDSSSLSPFVNRDALSSRYNLMHALLVRNLLLYLKNAGTIPDGSSLGVCTAYSAQARLLRAVLKSSALGVSAGTVHRYQGDEKRAMVLDIPDGLGEALVGFWLEADSPDEDGAKLFNVAISRAREHLIVIANLQYLDAKLPARALLRGFLHRMQEKGRVLDAREVLAYAPVLPDMKSHGTPIEFAPETLNTGLFNQGEFDRAWLADAERATKSIQIFSGFVTPQRVATYGDILRRKQMQGVAIRCVTRPPLHNGSIPPEDGKLALDALENIGCMVDTRWDIHEKVIIIDGEVIWFGSLNPLSHTGSTSEVMARLTGKEIASQIESFLSLDRGGKADGLSGIEVVKENPACPKCGHRTTYRKGRFGPYWECEVVCGWKENYIQHKARNKADVQAGGSTLKPCQKCGKPMVVRFGRYGSFLGCTDYPSCDGKHRLGSEKQSAAKKRRTS